MSPSQFPYCLLSLAMDAGNGTFMDHVVASANLRRACRRVVSNGGAPGCDGMTVTELSHEWPTFEEHFRQRLLAGDYQPAPLRRFSIRKPGGGWRILAIPTVLDRAAQQAVAQPLCALIDGSFSDSSFGFRPGRRAHDALLQSARFVEQGLTWVLHVDLEKFFDHAPHDRILQRIRNCVDDPRIHQLVSRFLSAPFSDQMEPATRDIGLPQGGPLSPLLANLVLDELDHRLDDAGFPFCRYADDLCLHFASADEASEAFALITPWIEQDLRLPINRMKTRIVPIEQNTFLGHRMTRSDGRVVFAPSTDALARLRRAIRRVEFRHRHSDGRERNAVIDRLLSGWSNYFRLCGGELPIHGPERWRQPETGHRAPPVTSPSRRMITSMRIAVSEVGLYDRISGVNRTATGAVCRFRASSRDPGPC